MSRRMTDDEGVATVFALVFLVVLATVTMVVGGVGVVLVARHRAMSAADLAALSVTSRALEGEEVACAAGRAVAAAQGARLVACHLEPDLDAEVRVAVRPPGRLGTFGELVVVARAGTR